MKRIVFLTIMFVALLLNYACNKTTEGQASSEGSVSEKDFKRMEFVEQMHYKLEGIKLTSQIKVIDSDSTEVLLNNCLGLNNKLVLFFNGNYCTCIDEELRLLREYSKSEFGKNIVFVLGFNSFKEYLIYKNNLSGIQVYKLDSEEGILDEYKNIVIYSITNSDLSLTNVFIPLNNNPTRTELYLETMKGKYFN